MLGRGLRTCFNQAQKTLPATFVIMEARDGARESYTIRWRRYFLIYVFS